jgi:hypothetical protein
MITISIYDDDNVYNDKSDSDDDDDDDDDIYLLTTVISIYLFIYIAMYKGKVHNFINDVKIIMC